MKLRSTKSVNLQPNALSHAGEKSKPKRSNLIAVAPVLGCLAFFVGTSTGQAQGFYDESGSAGFYQGDRSGSATDAFLSATFQVAAAQFSQTEFARLFGMTQAQASLLLATNTVGFNSWWRRMLGISPSPSSGPVRPRNIPEHYIFEPHEWMEGGGRWVPPPPPSPPSTSRKPRRTAEAEEVLERLPDGPDLRPDVPNPNLGSENHTGDTCFFDGDEIRFTDGTRFKLKVQKCNKD